MVSDIICSAAAAVRVKLLSNAFDECPPDAKEDMWDAMPPATRDAATTKLPCPFHAASRPVGRTLQPPAANRKGKDARVSAIYPRGRAIRAIVDMALAEVRSPRPQSH